MNEALLEDRARDLDLITTDKEVEEQIKRLKEQNKVTTDEEFEKALAASGLTTEKLRDQFRRTLTLQRVVGREVNSKVDLSDDALRVVYEREKETWRIPEKAHLFEILISRSADAAGAGTAEKKAREAADALKAGTKFEVVVKEYSDGSTKSRGGDLGWVAQRRARPRDRPRGLRAAGRRRLGPDLDEVRVAPRQGRREVARHLQALLRGEGRDPQEGAGERSSRSASRSTSTRSSATRSSA